MITISLCMIVKNAEDTIGDCLASVRGLVDEIVVLDTGSTDSTESIVRSYTDRIYRFAWIDDFAAARNESFRYASCSHILWLDADDVLLEEDRGKLLELKQTLSPDVDSVTMIYHYAFDEYGRVTVSLRRNRLIKRENGFRWHGAVHEYLAVSGKIEDSGIVVTHKRRHRQGGRNLAIFERKLENGETLTSRDRFYYANELTDNRHYEKAAAIYRELIEKNDGWSEDLLTSCGRLADICEAEGDDEEALRWALHSFAYDIPRAEFCCRLGYRFLQENRLTQAVYWYKLATELRKPEQSWGFFNDACWTWLPHIQLCICYYRLGDYPEAYRHNEKARAYRPDDPAVLSNKALLEGAFPHVFPPS
ncbi:glycosyltransferase [Paenibacillus contaminans]|uniref:Glycosyl transferase n=1 Tax=Paenibacillus contaminans TaxID=450362 RepID=A0A329MA05_9BACL|nr:glycosyltransferase [Paenibacillus contaminans]RAV16680.1 glycosyl transferase [Paenibacillus contaminans]